MKNKLEKMYSLKEASDLTGISIAMFKKLLRNYKLEYVKVGAKNFIKESVLLKYVNDNTVLTREY